MPKEKTKKVERENGETELMYQCERTSWSCKSSHGLYVINPRETLAEYSDAMSHHQSLSPGLFTSVGMLLLQS